MSDVILNKRFVVTKSLNDKQVIQILYIYAKIIVRLG